MKQIFYKANSVKTKRKIVDRCRVIIRLALDKKDGATFRHFYLPHADFRERVLRHGVIWGVMTSTIASEFDNEAGRAEILSIAQVDYFKYFCAYERLLLDKTSQLMREEFSDRQVGT